MINENITPLDIKTFLSKDRYRIPIYQRNYDWGEKETAQLIEDIADYAKQNPEMKYYIGSVVVFARKKVGEEYYETIDGQQRLTTLTILMNVLVKMDEVKDRMIWFKESNLSYDHREEADDAIRGLMNDRLSTHPSAAGITDVYKILKNKMRGILKNKDVRVEDFVDYLLKNVIIMRIPVPRDTELNHYFEIMNSRGEQLEKHEVLKANLMSYLEKDKNAYCLFNDVWEACSDMTTYVQMKMKPNLRKMIFSDKWTQLQYDDFEAMLLDYRHLNDDKADDGVEDDEYISRSLTKLFEDADNNESYPLPDYDKDAEGANDRFGSVINFPNFLLQVLKVMYQDEPDKDETIDANIKLDDKRLINIFKMVLEKTDDKCSFAKRYLMALLKIRNIFDSYVIKRENHNGKEAWSLKSPKKYDNSKVNYVGTFSGSDNEDAVSKDIRMLEAMFHVSAPTQIYKHWLNAVLYYVYSNETVVQKEMRDKLYTLAGTYMLDRYLGKETTEFETIIYKNDFLPTNSKIVWESIDYGCGVENFIFNFYDYVTWKTNPRKYPKFEFTYRTSVEHFYPQHAINGHVQLTSETGLDNFGNLCLISRGMNSKFSNNMPKAKFDNFGKGEGVHELSLKLNEMMEVVRTKGDWGEKEIADFEKLSRARILNGIKDGCPKGFVIKEITERNG